MVKLTGPMLSLTAQGTIGKTVTVSNWKGRSYMKTHTVPTNNQQQAQLGVRTAMTFLAQAWSTIDAADQLTWSDQAAAANVSPFDVYIGYNLTRITDGFAPTKAFPPAESSYSVSFFAPTFEVFATFVTLTLRLAPGGDAWTFWVYRDLQTGFTPGPANLVHLVPGVAFAGSAHIRDEPPSHDTWFYRFAAGNDDGSYDLRVAELEVTF